MTSQPQRPIFDPLVDSAIAKAAGRSEEQILQDMHAAGLAAPHAPVGVDAVIHSAAYGEVAAWKKLSPKERNDRWLAALKARQAAQTRGQQVQAVVEEHEDSLAGLSTGELDRLEERVQAARMAAWVRDQDMADAEQAGIEAHQLDPLWNDDEGEPDEEYGAA
jgi:hypothetical protein